MADPDFARANISFADVTRRLGVAGFGAWWLHELSSLVPARVRDAIERFGYDTAARRPSVSGATKVSLVLRAAIDAMTPSSRQNSRAAHR